MAGFVSFVACSSPRAAADTPAARSAAERHIAASRQRSAEYPCELANHLPMLTEIQVRLGATAERLDDYAVLYDRHRCAPLLPEPTGRMSRDDWQWAIGDRTREADLRAFFAAEVARLGAGGAIRRYVPVLAPGVGASALHALMRLAFAVLRADGAEVGVALGYWAATYLPLRDEPQGPADIDDPLELAEAMRGEPAFSSVGARDTDLLWHWMRATGGLDAFAPLIGRFRVGPDALDRIAGAGLALFAGDPHGLEGLHAMTGAWWVRLVADHLDDPAPLVRAFWQAVLALYPKMGLPPLPSAAALEAMRRIAPPPIEAIVAAALAVDPLGDEGEHDPSAVLTALAEHARTRDPLYLVAIARRVGLLD